MYNRKYSCTLRLMAIILVMALSMPMTVNAAIDNTVQTYASKYLSTYNAYICTMGSGKIEAWFTVSGTGYVGELGALRISIYESTNNTTWTLKATHTNETNPAFLSYNDYYHSGHVDYQGVAGRYYKAYVCIWGGSDGAGDTRYFWTSVKRAT